MWTPPHALTLWYLDARAQTGRSLSAHAALAARSFWGRRPGGMQLANSPARFREGFASVTYASAGGTV